MMLAALLRRKRLEMSCQTCQSSPEARRKWGCDEPLRPEDAANHVRCPRCRDIDAAKRHCSRCGGRGTVPLLRCPNAVLREDPSILNFLRCYDFLQVGILPGPGGLLGQSNLFLEACSVMRVLEADLDKEGEN